MEILKIQTTEKFDKLTEDWRTLQVYTFGPLIDLDYADRRRPREWAQGWPTPEGEMSFGN